MSILPVHITRIILRFGGYCILETPAKSAAEYAHQWHKNPSIFGSNPCLVTILSYTPKESLIYYSLMGCCKGRNLCFGWNRSRGWNSRIDLGINFFIGEMFTVNSRCWALGITDTISLTQDWINLSLLTFCCIDKFYSAVGTSRDTSPTRYALLLVYIADRTWSNDRIVC